MEGTGPLVFVRKNMFPVVVPMVVTVVTEAR